MRRRGKGRAEQSKSSALLNGRIPMATLVQTLAVAQYLSFHRAALALGTSQSSVSARVKALEDEIGITLFERNTRGVRLTEAGRRFIDQVGNALDIIDKAVKTAGMLARGEEGEIRVGVHALTTGCFLDRLMERFHNKHPGIRLNITETTARDAQIMVRQGKLDVAVMACTHEIPDLHSRVIWRDRLMVAVPAAHALAKLQKVEWRQLAEETFLVREGGTGPQIHDLIVIRSAGKWPVPAIQRFDIGHSALMSMIAAGRGISLLVEEGTAATTAEITFMPLSDEPDTIPFSAVWSPNNREPALINLLELASGPQ